MNASQDPLWQGIASFQFDEPNSRLTFSQRLARENGWKHSFALRVLEEYRRFIYLAMTCGHPVTPSEEVDQAWHLHLVYSDNYWNEFCGQVLGKPFHHGPTKGGAAEAAKHGDWYARTLASYALVFGHPVPGDIWRPAHERFSRSNRWQRVNRRDCWVVPKPRGLSTAAVWAALAGVVLTLTGCLAAQFAEIPLLDLPGPQFLVAFILLEIAAIAAAVAVRIFWSKVDATDAPSPTDPYVIALLNANAKLAVAAAVTELVRRKLLQPGARTVLQPLPDGNSTGLHPFEARVMEAVGSSTTFPALVIALKPDLATMEAQLESQHLLLHSGEKARIRWTVFVVTTAPVVLGALKICIGMSRGRPVSNLIVLEVFAAIIAFIFTSTISKCSSEGSRVIKDLRARFGHLKTSSEKSSDTGVPYPYPLAMAVFGSAVLANSPYAPLRNHLGLVGDSSSGDSSSGDSGGGGGDGGGGGGCGGCSS